MSNHERSITRLEPERNKTFFKLRKFVPIIVLLLITSCLYQIKPVSSDTIYVPTDFSTIQDAVNNATAGDTIQVAPNIYYEHVYVNKSLTIVGENPQTTIVDGTANGTVFNLEGSNVHISGFTIRNAGGYNAITSGKEIVTSDYHQITNNIITTSAYGVYLSSSDRNTIFNNTLINNVFAGIYLMDADYTNITANTIIEGAYGIKTALSLNNIIIGNTISQTSYAIYLSASSTGNTIRKNLLSGTTAVVASNSDNTIVDHNTITEGAYGIYLYNCRSGSVYYNTLMNNSYGIALYCSSATTTSHTISNNKILYTDWAIELVYSDDNTFTGNWIQQNTYGIYMSSSSSNDIYRNNFVNNNMQAYAGTGIGNVWWKSIQGKRQGNYWSDYTGVDEDPHDGIGDTPYTIYPIGSDDYPLMTTWSEHDISIQSITLSTNETPAGAIVNITVTVENIANTSVSETFDVTAKYDLNIIETKEVSDLAQGETQTLTFNWDTIGVAPGNYTISADASIVPDELNIDNNNFIDGTVEVSPSEVYPDVAIISVDPASNRTFQGLLLNITVVTRNEGDTTETFNVTVYYNQSVVGTQIVESMSPGTNATLIFTWNTTGVLVGNYTISAETSTIPGDADPSDNSLTDGIVYVRRPGDVNGDGVVDVLDVGVINSHWYPGPPVGLSGYDPDVDTNGDGRIDIFDLAIVNVNWG